MTTPPTTPGWNIITRSESILPRDAQVWNGFYQTWMSCAEAGRMRGVSGRFYQTRDASYAQESTGNALESAGIPCCGQCCSFNVKTSVDSSDRWVCCNCFHEWQKATAPASQPEGEGLGPSEWLELLMKCQNGEMTCMRLMEIIEQETVSIKWVRQQNEKLRELCYAIEALPASEQQTDISLKASNIAHEMQRVVNFNYTQTTNQKEVKTCATLEAEAVPNAVASTATTGTTAPVAVSNAAAPEVQSSEQAATGSPPESVREQLAASQADSKRLLAALKVLLRTVGALTNRTGATTEVFAAMKQAQVEIDKSDQKEGA